MNPDAAAQAVLDSPLFGLTVTLGAYWVGLRLWRALGRTALAHPVLTATALIAGVLALSGISYEQYLIGGQLITFLLGPATVALALPLYRQFTQVRRAALLVVGSVLVGSVIGVISGYLITSWLGGTRELALSMAPKSVTTPISVALAERIGGIAPLTAVITVVTGIVAAVVGPALLTLFRITDPRARGLAMGGASHGIGTARALQESETAGAFSGLSMGLSGLTTSLIIGVVLTWIAPLG